MDPKKDWYEFKTLKRRGYDSQVWVPLRAAWPKQRDGENGHLGFVEEYLSVGVLAVDVRHEAAAKSIDANHIRDAGRSVPYVDSNGVYVPADRAVGFHRGIDGVRLVLEQSVPGVDHQEWHLSQDFALGLNLVREGDKWVRVEEGREEVVRLTRGAHGEPVLLEAKVEFVKDFLAARKMGLLVGIFTSRTTVEKDDPDLPWERPTEFADNATEGWRWRGDITPIHEGGHQFGSMMRVFSMSRTDFDDEDEAPALEVGGEFKSDQWTVPMGKGGKVFRTSGEMWKTEWISPSANSPRVAEEETPSTAHFIVGGSGKKVSGDDLPHGLVWLWFRPQIVNSALGYPDGWLNWHSADTGHLAFTPSTGVHFGVNEMGYVTVLAVDIERLPHWDQERWAAFTAAPTGKVSEELVDSQVRTAPASTVAPEAELESSMERLAAAVQKKYRIPLYHADIDRGILRSAHRFMAVNDDGLLNLAKDLTRLFSDRLDAGTLQKTALPDPPKQPYGSLKALEHTLATIIPAGDAATMCSALFGIYDLRLADAHLPGRDLESAFRRANIDRTKPLIIQGHDMILALTLSLVRIATIIEASIPTVEIENRLPVPSNFAERFGIEPGVDVVFIDSGRDGEFKVRVLRSSYAGALAGVYGTTEENVALVRSERDPWGLLPVAFEANPPDEIEQQFIYAKLLSDMTCHFGSFRVARLWFETRQPALGGKTPLDIIESGNRDALIGLAHMITSLSPD